MAKAKPRLQLHLAIVEIPPRRQSHWVASTTHWLLLGFLNIVEMTS